MTVHASTATTHPDVPPEWLDDHLPTVFSRWHPHLAHLQAATAQAVIAAARVRPGMVALDIGSGSGIPALDVGRLVGSTGRVVATDPSPTYLAALRDNALAAGLTNVETVEASAASLPFPPSTFDAATCHMGAMFFADLPAGLARIRETLRPADGTRPGARAAFVAWGPDTDNTFIPTFWSAVRPHLPPAPTPEPPASPSAPPTDGPAEASTPSPPPDPDTPRPTRFAEPGTLSAALDAAGFADVEETSPLVDLVWPEPPASLVAFWLELSGLATRLDPARLSAVRAAAETAYVAFSDRAGATVRMPVRIVVASGAA